MSQYTVHKSIAINATPQQVWEALTNPDLTKKYFFHCEVHSGWQVGDTITFKGHMFLVINIEMTGHILEIEPARLLKYNLKNGKEADTSAGYSTVTDLLTYQDGVTTLTISDDVGDGEGAEKRMEKSEKGWNEVLAGLKKVVEEGNEQ